MGSDNQNDRARFAAEVTLRSAFFAAT